MSYLRTGASSFYKGAEMKKKPENLFHFYTFVAEDALKTGDPFQLSCNCGGKVTIMPPIQEDSVVCPLCESTIKMLVIEGDPGCIIGADEEGKPMLIPVQGSQKKQPCEMSEQEIHNILKDIPTAARENK